MMMMMMMMMIMMMMMMRMILLKLSPHQFASTANSPNRSQTAPGQYYDHTTSHKNKRQIFTIIFVFSGHKTCVMFQENVQWQKIR